MELKFNNILDFKIDFSSLSEGKVQELLDKNIILYSDNDPKKIGSYDSFFSLSANEVILIKDAWEIKHDGLEYKINYKILDEIYYWLMEQVKSYDETFDKLTEIKICSKNKLSKTEKIEYLRNEYYNSLNEQDIKSYSHYLIFYENGVNSIEWKNLVFEYVWYNSSKEILQKYLCTDSYFLYTELVEAKMFNVPKYKKPFPARLLLPHKEVIFVNEWRKYERHKIIADFCNSEIDKIENNGNIENLKSLTNKSLKNTTQKVLLFDKILNYRDWKKLSENKRSEILSGIFDVHKDTVRDSLAVVNPAKSANKISLNDDVKAVNDFLIKLGVCLGDPNL